MILPDDFRDLLIELHDAGAEFVVLGGHAVGQISRLIIARRILGYTSKELK